MLLQQDGIYFWHHVLHLGKSMKRTHSYTCIKIYIQISISNIFRMFEHKFCFPLLFLILLKYSWGWVINIMNRIQLYLLELIPWKPYNDIWLQLSFHTIISGIILAMGGVCIMDETIQYGSKSGQNFWETNYYGNLPLITNPKVFPSLCKVTSTVLKITPEPCTAEK